MSQRIQAKFNEVISSIEQQSFVQSLIDNGVSYETIASALPTHVAASLVGNHVSVESYRNDLYGTACVEAIVSYNGYEHVKEAYLELIRNEFDGGVSLEDLSSSADALKNKVSEGVDKLKEKLTKLKAYAAEQSKKGADYAKEHPYKAAASIMAIIALSTAALLLCKFLMKRNSDIKSAYKDLSDAKSAFEQSFAKNADELAKHGMTPDGVGMKLGTKGTAAAFTKDTMRSNVHYPYAGAEARKVNVSALQRKVDSLWPKYRASEADLKKLVDAGQGSSEAARKLRDAMNGFMKDIVESNNAQAALPGDVVYKSLNEIDGSKVTWDYTTLSKKIDEATASLDKLKGAFNTAKEFTQSLKSGLNPMGTGATDNFSPGKLIVVWKISVYGSVSALVAGLLSKISKRVNSPEK